MRYGDFFFSVRPLDVRTAKLFPIVTKFAGTIAAFSFLRETFGLASIKLSERLSVTRRALTRKLHGTFNRPLRLNIKNLLD